MLNKNRAFGRVDVELCKLPPTSLELMNRNTSDLIITEPGREILTAPHPLVLWTVINSGSALSVRTETGENCVFVTYISDTSWARLNGE